MDIDFSELEIRLLLKCTEGLLNRAYLNNLYRKFSKADRSKAITRLVQQNMLKELRLPKPGAKKTPVFYEITEKGDTWVHDYLANYPK